MFSSRTLARVTAIGGALVGGVVAVTWAFPASSIDRSTTPAETRVVTALTAPGQGPVGNAELHQTPLGVRMTVALTRVPAGARLLRPTGQRATPEMTKPACAGFT